MKPEISVIIPTLNEEKYLPRLLDSLRNQALEWGKDFEVIVVDGHSTDRTAEIAEEYGCRLLVSSVRSPAYQRNMGAEQAIGDFLVFLDADTIADSSLLAKVKIRLKAGAGLVTAYISVDGKYKYAGLVNSLLFHILTILGIPHVNGSCMAMRKSLFMKAGGFNTETKLAEDHLLAGKVSKFSEISYIRKQLIVDSSRRINKEGIWFPVYLFIYTLFHLLMRVPVRTISYKFGEF